MTSRYFQTNFSNESLPRDSFSRESCSGSDYDLSSETVDEIRDRNVPGRRIDGYTRRYNERNNYHRFNARFRFHNASIRESWIGRTASLLRTMAFNEFPLQRVGSSAHCPDRPDGSEKKEVAKKKGKKKKKLREVTFDRWNVKMVSADFVESRAVTRVLCIRRYLGSGRERNGGKKNAVKKRSRTRGGSFCLRRGGIYLAFFIPLVSSRRRNRAE